MHTKITLLSAALIYSMQTSAAPNDLFLQTKDLNAKTDSNLNLTFGLDAVNDTIDIFDIRQSEGVADTSTGDYQGFHIKAQYDINPQWAIEGAYWHREIEYSKDTNEIHSALLGVRYNPQFNLDKNDHFVIRGSIWANRADSINKKTPTSVNQRTFEQVNVQNPEDLQLQIDTIFSRKLDHMNQINLFASAGFSQVKVDNINIRALNRGCLMDISVNKNNQYTGNLVQECEIDKLIVKELKIQGDANEYGLDVKKDLNYDSYYAAIGGSWNWRYKNFESQLAYQYQRLWRDNIDDRVASFGNNAIKDNHTLGAKLSYDFSKKVTGFLQGELYQHNFVGQIPFLYNGVTASRLDKRYGLVSLGINFHHF